MAHNVQEDLDKDGIKQRKKMINVSSSTSSTSGCSSEEGSLSAVEHSPRSTSGNSSYSNKSNANSSSIELALACSKRDNLNLKAKFEDEESLRKEQRRKRSLNSSSTPSTPSSPSSTMKASMTAKLAERSRGKKTAGFVESEILANDGDDDDEFELNDHRSRLDLEMKGRRGSSEFCALTIRRKFLQSAESRRKGLSDEQREFSCKTLGPRQADCFQCLELANGLTSKASSSYKLNRSITLKVSPAPRREVTRLAEPEGQERCLECCKCCCCCFSSSNSLSYFISCDNEDYCQLDKAPLRNKQKRLKNDQKKVFSSQRIRSATTLNSRREQRQVFKQATVGKLYNSSRTFARRPLPVPPPVVPLYKELALHDEEASKMMIKTTNDICDNRMSISLIDVAGKTRELREKAEDSSLDVKTKNYSSNWNELSSSNSWTNLKHIEAKDEESIDGGQTNLEVKNDKNKIPSRYQEPSTELSWNTSTLSKRTGLLFERLKKRIIANFSAIDTTSISTSQDNNLKSSPEMGDCRISWKLKGDREFNVRGNCELVSSGEHVNELKNSSCTNYEQDSSIYDTPEAWDRPSGSSCLSSSSNNNSSSSSNNNNNNNSFPSTHLVARPKGPPPLPPARVSTVSSKFDLLCDCVKSSNLQPKRNDETCDEMAQSPSTQTKTTSLTLDTPSSTKHELKDASNEQSAIKHQRRFHFSDKVNVDLIEKQVIERQEAKDSSEAKETSNLGKETTKEPSCSIKSPTKAVKWAREKKQEARRKIGHEQESKIRTTTTRVSLVKTSKASKKLDEKEIDLQGRDSKIIRVRDQVITSNESSSQLLSSRIAVKLVGEFPKKASHPTSESKQHKSCKGTTTIVTTRRSIKKAALSTDINPYQGPSDFANKPSTVFVSNEGKYQQKEEKEEQERDMGANQSNELGNLTECTGSSTFARTQQKLRDSLRRTGQVSENGIGSIRSGCYEGSINKPTKSTPLAETANTKAHTKGHNSIKSLTKMTSKLIHSADHLHRNNKQQNSTGIGGHLYEIGAKCADAVKRSPILMANGSGLLSEQGGGGGQGEGKSAYMTTNSTSTGKVLQNNGSGNNSSSCSSSRSNSNKTSEVKGKQRNQDHSERGNKNRCFDSELERRRASIRNGDVFIYPSIYTDLNECHKCFRDKLVCNCNNSITSTLSPSNSSPCSTGSQLNSTKTSTSTLSNNTTTSSSADNSLNATTNNNHQTQRASITLKSLPVNEEYSDGQSDFHKTTNPTIRSPNITDKRSIVKTNKLILTKTQEQQLQVGMAEERSQSKITGGPPGLKGEMRTIEARNDVQLSSNNSDRTSNNIVEQITKCSNPDNTSKPPVTRPRSMISQDNKRVISIGCKSEPVSIMERRDNGETSAIDIGAAVSNEPAHNSTEDRQRIVANFERANSVSNSVSVIERGNDKDGPILSYPIKLVNHFEEENKSISKQDTNLNSETSTRNCSKGCDNKTETYSDCAKMMQVSVGRQHNNDESNLITSNFKTNYDNTSIVAIETISRRRKNLFVSKMTNRLPIHDEGDGMVCKIDNPLNVAITPQLNDHDHQQVILLPDSLNIKRTDSLDLPSPITNESASNSEGINSANSSGDVFEYSPILSSVRDYINNFNAELQVQNVNVPATPDAIAATSSTITIPTETCLAITTNQSTIHKLSYSNNDQLDPVRPASELMGKSTSYVSSSSLVLSPLTVITAPTNVMSESVVPIVVDNPASVVSLSAEANFESPKRSIFDGASKDEILEYLEDARERVPDILMAADDVMVINENELLVVNQLEPNSPATPISILNASEVLQNAQTTNTSSLVCLETNSNQAYPSNTNPAIIEQDERDTEQIKHHLRELYKKTSHFAKNSHFSSGADTIDDDISCQPMNEITASSNIDMTDSEFSRSMSESVEPNSDSFSAIHSVFSNSKSLCSTYRTISDSIDNIQPNYSNILQNVESMNNIKENKDDVSIQKIGSKHSHTIPIPLQRVNSSRDDCKITDMMGIQKSNPGLRNDNFRCLLENIDNNPTTTNKTVTRRKSTSDESHRSNDRKSALQNMMIMQRYSNRDSLSSSSSSPPPSTSPSSSSSSSHQTSGNSSAASNFYASSSLSCSSPLFPVGNLLTSSNSNGSSNIVELQQGNFLIREINSSGFSDRDDAGVCNLESIHEATKDTNEQEFQDNKTTLCQQILDTPTLQNLASSNQNLSDDMQQNKLSIIEECHTHLDSDISNLDKELIKSILGERRSVCLTSTDLMTKTNRHRNLTSKTLQEHYSTMNRLNNYFMNRHNNDNTSGSKIEFQCLDCDQFIDIDRAKLMHQSNDVRQLKASDEITQTSQILMENHSTERPLSPDQLDKAYIAAMIELPLCKLCEKKRKERKEIIAEFVDTELKYGCDLKIIHEEFYRPMQIAGLLSKDQINGVFLNLEELIMANCKFSNRLTTAIDEANLMGDTDYNTVNIGKLFVDSAEMLHTFESYCIRQGPAACLLARLAKERELLRIFLRVSQMENTLLRRMNLAAFLMVPVQRVTRYPLLLNRLYKVTAYHHRDREALRDAQLKVELHLEHINQQTKGVGATNKIWRRISNLSAPMSNRRGLFNAEDIGYIKLRKTAMDILKWDRDDAQFIHSGRINFSPLNEYLSRQKAKSIRYMSAHALLIVLGKPNWKYRPDLVKSNLDNKMMIPTPGGNGIKEAVLMLFREKNGRFIPCRDPLFLSNCVLSMDCSQFNCDGLTNPACHHTMKSTVSSGSNNSSTSNASYNTVNVAKSTTNSGTSSNGHHHYRDQKLSANMESKSNDSKSNSIEPTPTQNSHGPIDTSAKLMYNTNEVVVLDGRNSAMNGDAISMSSLKSLPEENGVNAGRLSNSPPVHTSRSYSLASALPRTTTPINGGNSSAVLTKSTSTTSSSTIFNQLITKVNNYHHKQTTSKGVANLISDHHSLTEANRLESHRYKSSPTTTNTTPVGGLSQQSSSLDMSSSQNKLTTNDTSQKDSQNNKSNIGKPTSVPNTTNEINQLYNHHYFHNHHQLYGDYEESFEVHDRLTKESLLLRADTLLKTRYWLQMLRYHAKDLGQWRNRRTGLANIMMMRQE